MEAQLEMQATVCAICGTLDEAYELYPASFDESSLTPEIFSARRIPDRVHFRFVRCRRCGLVRSDPVVAPDILAALYERASFSYADETAALARTYGGYLRRLERFGVRKGSLLDIGCGNGFLLEEALRQGYSEVHGVEPAADVARAASDEVRDSIVVGMFGPGLFEPDSVDVVTIFQTLDHLPDPNEALAEVVCVLKPGGLLLCLNHDVQAWSARLLGERSPIFDIEHTYLYSRETLARLVGSRGLESIESGRVLNHYTLQYFAQLPPLPTGLRRSLLAGLDRTRIGRLPLTVPLGNLWLVARKP